MQGHATSNVHDYVQDFFDVKKKSKTLRTGSLAVGYQVTDRKLELLNLLTY